MKFIVSRFNEPIDWLTELTNVEVIDKGQPCAKTTKIMPNVGREGHTYYKYIVDNYNVIDPNEHYCFLQGHPFDHSPNILDRILNLPEKIPEFWDLCETHYLTDLQQSPIKFVEDFKRTYFAIFNQDLKNDEFVFGSGAQFSVLGSLILTRSIEFYQKIVEILSHDISPIEGYVLERLHPEIFGQIDHL